MRIAPGWWTKEMKSQQQQQPIAKIKNNNTKKKLNCEHLVYVCTYVRTYTWINNNNKEYKHTTFK